MSPSRPNLHDTVRDNLRYHVKPARDSLLFSSDSGGHLYESVAYKRWNATRNVAGRPDLRFHDLRHTGTVAAQAGATTAELHARLGHTTFGAAMIYQGPGPTTGAGTIEAGYR